MAKYHNAGFWIRFAAYLVDSIILSVFARLIFGNQCPDTGYCISYDGWQMIIPIAYILGFWIWKSATPGKMLFKLKIVGENGKPLTPKEAVIRLLSYIVSGVVLGLGFLWIAFDKEKQGWHDKIAKTHVVRS